MRRTIYIRGPVGRGESERLGPNNRIVACDLSTGALRDVATAAPSSVFTNLAISPDGRTLAVFVIGLEAGGAAVNFQAPIMRLAVVGTDGAAFREVHGPFVMSSFLRWGDGGRTLWIQPGVPSSGVPPAPGPIRRVDAATGAVVSTDLQLTSAGLPSPDGTRLVISKQTSGLVTEVHAIEGVSAMLKRR